jgi:hypothetical protein
MEMKTKSMVKRILGISLLALVSSGALVAAAPVVIDIEPEQCQVRCLYIMGVRLWCYEICF